MIFEIREQITPLAKKLAEKYKPYDIVQALLIVAFDLHLLQDDKQPARASNTFRALTDNTVRARLQKE